MRLLKITLDDLDGGPQKRWTFAGEHAHAAARIEAMIRLSKGPAGPAVTYTLAIRSEVWGSLYVDSRRPHGPMTDDLGKASRWATTERAWAWWEKHKGDDTRRVEVVRADTGEVVEVGEPVAVEGETA